MISLPASKYLQVTSPAKQDLIDIGNYTKETWGIKQKQQYMGQLRQCFDALCQSPSLGKVYASIDDSLYAYFCQKHVVFYRVTQEELRIIRVLHQNMDIETQLSTIK